MTIIPLTDNGYRLGLSVSFDNFQEVPEGIHVTIAEICRESTANELPVRKLSTEMMPWPERSISSFTTINAPTVENQGKPISFIGLTFIRVGQRLFGGMKTITRFIAMTVTRSGTQILSRARKSLIKDTQDENNVWMKNSKDRARLPSKSYWR